MCLVLIYCRTLRYLFQYYHFYRRTRLFPSLNQLWHSAYVITFLHTFLMNSWLFPLLLCCLPVDFIFLLLYFFLIIVNIRSFLLMLVIHCVELTLASGVGGGRGFGSTGDPRAYKCSNHLINILFGTFGI